MKRPMNILMLGWELPPIISGGLGTACFGLTKGLHDIGAGCAGFVIPFRQTSEDARFVNLIALGAADEASASSAQRHSSYGRDLFAIADRYAMAMTALAQTGRHIDIIHAHDWLTAQAGVRLKKLTGRPLLVHIHSTEIERSGIHANHRIVTIERDAMNQADQVVAVSEYTRNILIKHYGQESSKVITIHNGCLHGDSPVPWRPKSSGPVTVTFLGRITYQKGPRYFIEAAALALRRRPSLEFVMAGDGDLLDSMKALAREKDIASRIYFPGFLDADEVRHLLGHTDIYVMPSVAEPFGISALEAIQAGASAIISRTSGAAEVLRNVIKLDHDNAEAIAEEIIGLADDPARARTMNIRARGELIDLTWSNSARKLQSVYESIHSPESMKIKQRCS